MRRRRPEPRFVVRSVSGFPITQGAGTRTDGKEKTIWSVHDSAYCYRTIPLPPGSKNNYGNEGRRNAGRFARLLNEKVAS